jgi:hypothetical protein
MEDVPFRIRTADQTREAEITASRSSTGRELLQLATAKWQMPSDIDYRLQNTSRHCYIEPDQTLSKDVLLPNDMLQIEPVLVAG